MRVWKRQVSVLLLIAIFLGVAVFFSACSDDSVSSDEPYYYFVDGFLLGSYENGTWYSNGSSYHDIDSPYYFSTPVNKKEYLVSQLLAVDAFYLYAQEFHSPAHAEHLALSNELLWNLSYGLGGFEDEDRTESLGQYATAFHEDLWYHQFTLPIEIGANDDCVIPDYNFGTYFIAPLAEDQLFYNIPLATNAPFSCLADEVYDDRGDDFAKRAMMDLIGERGLDGTAYNFTQFISADFDNDGALEYITIDNTPIYDDGWPVVDALTKGSHSAVLYNDGTGAVDVLFSCLIPYTEIALPDGIGSTHPFVSIDHCYSVDAIGVYDLNNDGYLELCLRVNLWESGYIAVFSYNPSAEQMVLVMQANYGN